MDSKKHIVVLTGAGISAESGLKTFRDTEDGLWNGYDIEDVATPGAWRKNPKLVLDFYNYRRAEVLKAAPNAAHTGLAALEQHFEVTIITQNIDDLHERGGSSRIVHLHGEIFKMRSEKNEDVIYPIEGNIVLGDEAADGFQLRPHIVWFGEAVPMIKTAAEIVATADYFAVIGTSLAVYPAAGLVNLVPSGVPIFIVDKQIPAGYAAANVTEISMPATAGVVRLTELLLTIENRMGN